MRGGGRQREKERGDKEFCSLAFSQDGHSNQKPRTQSWSYSWVTGTQFLEPLLLFSQAYEQEAGLEAADIRLELAPAYVLSVSITGKF